MKWRNKCRAHLQNKQIDLGAVEQEAGEPPKFSFIAVLTYTCLNIKLELDFLEFNLKTKLFSILLQNDNTIMVYSIIIYEFI